MDQARNGRWSRRRFLAMAGGAAALWQRRSSGAAPTRRPNVLILQPDQHRGTVMGCAGDTQAITPNLDRLATEGIRFTNAASASPVCSPFRGSFQTGLYPHQHRVVRNNIRMSPDLTTFAEVFARAGRATGYIGKWHLDGGWPPVEGGEGVTPKAVGGFVEPARRQGWQEWHGYEKAHEFLEVWTYNAAREKVRVKGYGWEPTWQTDVALDFVRRQRDRGKPWLYYVAYGPPHLPEQCPKRFLDLFPPEKFVLPPDVEAQLPEARKPELRQQMQVYYALVAAVDHEVGRLMKGLRELGVEDNTIVLYTSDHGDYLGSHAGAKRRLRGKGSPHATAFRIPLVVRWPGRILPGQVCEELVSSVDLAETVLDLAGLPVPKGMQGHSKAGWCLGGKGHHSDCLYLGIGDNRPIPPESIRPSRKSSRRLAGMRRVVDKALPAGPGIGRDPKRMPSGNWDCGYDERLTVDLPPGKHKVAVEQVGRGRVEVEYTLRNYVDGQAEFLIPTSPKHNFGSTPHHEFRIAADGAVAHAESLRPHLYGSRDRRNPPVFVLDCTRPAQLEVRVTKSVGDGSKRLRIYVDGGGGAAAKRPAKARRGGWWRAVWDGRYVYRPGRGGWLYDHKADPCEMKNLVASAEHEAVRRRLARRLLEFAVQTQDPVLPELRAMLAKDA